MIVDRTARAHGQVKRHIGSIMLLPGKSSQSVSDPEGPLHTLYVLLHWSSLARCCSLYNLPGSLPDFNCTFYQQLTFRGTAR